MHDPSQTDGACGRECYPEFMTAVWLRGPEVLLGGLFLSLACASEDATGAEDEGSSGAEMPAPGATMTNDEGDPPDDDDDATTGEGEDEPGTASGESDTGSQGPGRGSTDDGDGSGSSAGDADGSSGGGADAGMDTGEEGVANGGDCDADAECASNRCFEAGPLGGICGECNEDDDCPRGGCTPPNPLTSGAAVCNDGGYADGCETSAVCTGDLVCEVVVDIPAIIETATCGECGARAPCGGDALCEPNYSLFSLSGVWECVAPGSLVDGLGCDLAGDGSACASGLCASAVFMDLFVLGVCSECIDDDDCLGGTCDPAEISVAGLVPGQCV